MATENLDIEIYDAKHDPIISEYARRIKLVETVDRCIKGEMELSPGVVTLAMVIDALSGRTPLYRLKESFQNKDLAVLLGEKIDREQLGDHTLGRVLDRLYEYGTQKLFTEISTAGLAYAQIKETAGHFDTTSVRVWGDFDPNEDDPFLMQYGFSKDKRPDLKQFVVTLLTVKGGLPTRFSIEDGAASDRKLNADVLSMIAEHFAANGMPNFIAYVADSAMVNQKNLELLDDTPFITRLPASYKECGRVIREAVDQNQWEEIGTLSQARPTPKRPAAHYRAADLRVTLYGKEYRATVLHSSAHDHRRTAALERKLASDKKKLLDQAELLGKKTFYCEPDAATAAALVKDGRYYRCTTSVVEVPVFNRGRPPKNGERKPKAIHYQIQVHIEPIEERISKAKKEAGCFVLLSQGLGPEDENSRNAKQLLTNYKEQHGVEKGFEFLKDPMILDSLFLKKPSRIEALGLIMVIALFIWRLMQFIMRKNCKTRQKSITGWVKRLTQNPTSFMMVTKFGSIQVMNVNGSRRFSRKLTVQQREYLDVLEVSEAVYKEIRKHGS